MTPGHESVAAEGDRIVSGERRTTYGHPYDNYTAIADATAALNIDVTTPRGAALFMIVTKLAREAHLPKRDNLVDICGYAKVVELIDERAAEIAAESDSMVQRMHDGEDPISVYTSLARTNPTRYKAEVLPILTEEEAAAVRARLEAF